MCQDTGRWVSLLTAGFLSCCSALTAEAIVLLIIIIKLKNNKYKTDVTFCYSLTQKDFTFQ